MSKVPFLADVFQVIPTAISFSEVRSKVRTGHAHTKDTNAHVSRNITLHYKHYRQCGKYSSVGTATRYGLDGSGFESRRRHYFPGQYWLAPRPSQPPVQWVTTSLSRGYSSRGEVPATHPHLAPRLKAEQSYTSTPHLGLPGPLEGKLTFDIWPFTLHTDMPSTSAQWQQASLVFGTCSKQSLGLLVFIISFKDSTNCFDTKSPEFSLQREFRYFVLFFKLSGPKRDKVTQKKGYIVRIFTTCASYQILFRWFVTTRY
jgi:hypothetical protein